jgi:hypothetical protein
MIERISLKRGRLEEKRVPGFATSPDYVFGETNVRAR